MCHEIIAAGDEMTGELWNNIAAGTRNPKL